MDERPPCEKPESRATSTNVIVGGVMKMAEDSFRVFTNQIRSNWHILTALVVAAFAATVAGANASNSISDQGSRLSKVEQRQQDQTAQIATLEERSRITLETVQRIDANLDELMRKAPR